MKKSRSSICFDALTAELAAAVTADELADVLDELAEDTADVLDELAEDTADALEELAANVDFVFGRNSPEIAPK